MSDYYLAPLFDCLSLMLPPGFKRRPLTYVRPAFWIANLPEDLPEAERAVLTRINELGETESEALKREVGRKQAGKALASLIRKGLVARTYRLGRPGAAPRVVMHVRLTVEPDAALGLASRIRAQGARGAARRAAAIEALAEEGAMTLARARGLGLSGAALRDLESEGVVTIEETHVVRDPLAGRAFTRREAPQLTSYQQVAADAIAAALYGDPATFLLHGVTGSGKTEVYLAALDRAVALGKRGIVLVPEIALTPQTVRRFGERFPGQVVVMHSALAPGEHYDMWRRVKAGACQVVVGPRGALFAPQPDLGLVIIDEEHEWTYKQQDATPRYHARRAAEELCRLTGATLVLGSATPDVETHFRAVESQVRLLELPERLVSSNGDVKAAPLPEVEVVDLREELKAGNRSIFSRSLASGIRQALAADEQVILFLNRRGTSSFVQCRDCGHVPECHSCAAALTYHAPASRLICHYCGRTRELPVSCPACNSGRFRQVGLGTERVEEAVRQEFPAARVLRWDRDVTRRRDAHESILARFVAREADVLVGTQMIAKGLDIPSVTLVGVISADIALHLPDFRAGERTFQLLEQVAGRAGRGPRGGRVVVQTYTPEHYAIEAAASHDYHALFERECSFRRRLGYPPYGRLARLTFSHTGEAYARRQAADLTRAIRAECAKMGIPNVDVLGPAPAYVPRIRGRWRWNVIIRAPDPGVVLRQLTLPRGWVVDIDPMTLL
jgi:primosomal protein N' (replication factor Y)